MYNDSTCTNCLMCHMQLGDNIREKDELLSQYTEEVRMYNIICFVHTLHTVISRAETNTIFSA